MRSSDDLPLDLSSRHRDLLAALLRRHVPGAEVWAYGSRVTGGAHEGSDLDLVLRNPRDPSRRFATVDDLREALAASALPMLVQVHDWADLPAPLRRNIEAGYAVVQAAAPAPLTPS